MALGTSDDVRRPVQSATPASSVLESLICPVSLDGVSLLTVLITAPFGGNMSCVP